MGGKLALVSQDTPVEGHELGSWRQPGRKEGEPCSDQDLMVHWMMAQVLDHWTRARVLDCEDEGPNRENKITSQTSLNIT